MKMLLVCILKVTLIVSFVSSEGNEVPQVMCVFKGIDSSETNYKFDATKIPERCSAVQYGAYFMDAAESAAKNEADIGQAVNHKRPVYLYASFMNGCQFQKLVDPKDQISYDTFVKPLLTYVKKNKISGIIFDCLELFDNKTADYPTKLNGFICKMKTELKDLKVGLTVMGDVYGGFTDGSFDFKIVNEHVDVFLIDTSLSGVNCDENAIKTGLMPIQTDQNNVAALQGICEATQKSGMSSEKVVIKFTDNVQYLIDGKLSYVSYKTYCTRNPDDTKNTLYCPDSIDRFYERGQYVNKYFKGIVIFSLDGDDYDGSCGCNKTFPVANAYIDGFQSAQKTACALC